MFKEGPFDFLSRKGSDFSLDADFLSPVSKTVFFYNIRQLESRDNIFSDKLKAFVLGNDMTYLLKSVRAW